MLCGLASIALVSVWTHRLLGPRFPSFLPALLLATSPAFLIYIRNARYYSLGVLFTVLLFAAACNVPIARRGRIWSVAVAMGATAAWVVTHYIYAAYALAGLAFLFVLRRYRYQTPRRARGLCLRGRRRARRLVAADGQSVRDQRLFT